jgi:hypothetical protein
MDILAYFSHSYIVDKKCWLVIKANFNPEMHPLGLDFDVLNIVNDFFGKKYLQKK